MTARDYLTKARSEDFAIGAFNVCNLETLKAIIAAAKSLQAPVIIEASHGEIEYFGGQNLVDFVRHAREDTGLPLFTNLDHAPSLEDALQGLKWGFDLVHYNGSSLPFAKNISSTAEFVTKAHAQNILVEAELNPIQNNSSVHNITAKEELAQVTFTKPEEAAQFAKETQVDTIAASFGSIHGLYSTPKALNLDLLKQIAAVTPSFLSLHGGSDIPADQVRSAISLGIVKINVNSELRLAFRSSLKQALDDSQELAAYKYMTPVIASVQQIIEKKIQLFGSAGKA